MKNLQVVEKELQNEIANIVNILDTLGIGVNSISIDTEPRYIDAQGNPDSHGYECEKIPLSFPYEACKSAQYTDYEQMFGNQGQFSQQPYTLQSREPQGVLPSQAVEFPAPLSKDTQKALVKLSENAKLPEPIDTSLITPAYIKRDRIVTPDQTNISFNNPTTVMSGVFSTLNDIGIDYIEDTNPVEMYDLFRLRYTSIVKQIVISAFNTCAHHNINDGLVDIKIDDSNSQNGYSGIGMHIFHTRKTLDLILNWIDSAFSYVSSFDRIFNNVTSAINTSFVIMSNIYNQCLNRVNSKEDTIKLCNFMDILMDTLPPAYVDLGKEYRDLYNTESYFSISEILDDEY